MVPKNWTMLVTIVSSLRNINSAGAGALVHLAHGCIFVSTCRVNIMAPVREDVRKLFSFTIVF